MLLWPQVVRLVRSGYDLLKPYEVNIIKPLPGLVGLKSEKNLYKSLDGIRSKGKLFIKDKKTKKVCWSEEGEILFKSDGLSGIVAMQASSFINRTSKELNTYSVSFDMLSNMSAEELVEYIDNKKMLYPNYSMEFLLTGLVNKMLAFKILKIIFLNKDSQSI